MWIVSYPWLTSGYHKESNPRQRGCVVQKVGDDCGNQAAASQKVGQAPQHAEKRSGQRDPEPNKKALIQIASVGEPKGNARHKDLQGRTIASLSELGHEVGAKEHFFTETSRDPKSEGGKEMESVRQ